MPELPLSDTAWELAGAYADNEATPAERAQVEADPALLSLVSQIRVMAGQVAWVEPAPASIADAQISAAVAASAPTVVALTPRPVPKNAHPRRGAWFGALAAASLLAVGIAGLRSVAGSNDSRLASAPAAEVAGPSATTAAVAAASPAVEGSNDNADHSNKAVGTVASPATTAAAAATTALTTAPTTRPAALVTAPRRSLATAAQLAELVATTEVELLASGRSCAPTAAPLSVAEILWRGVEATVFTDSTRSVVRVVSLERCDELSIG